MKPRSVAKDVNAIQNIGQSLAFPENIGGLIPLHVLSSCSGPTLLFAFRTLIKATSIKNLTLKKVRKRCAVYQNKTSIDVINAIINQVEVP